MKRALFIVDVQHGFISDDIVRGVVQQIEKVAGKFTGNILVSKFRNQPNSNYEKLLGWAQMRDPDETSIPEQIASQNPVIFEKFGYTALTTESLNYLRSNNFDEVYLCGVDTDQCVLATAFDLFSHNFKVLVMADCCASGGGQLFHEYGLALLARSLGRDQIISSHGFLAKESINI